MAQATVTLYSRPGCHLCDEARALLLRAGRGLDMNLDEVNIDADESLRDRYGIRIPVAVIGGQELDWPFTETRAQAALRTNGA